MLFAKQKRVSVIYTLALSVSAEYIMSQSNSSPSKLVSVDMSVVITINSGTTLLEKLPVRRSLEERESTAESSASLPSSWTLYHKTMAPSIALVIPDESPAVLKAELTEPPAEAMPPMSWTELMMPIEVPVAAMTPVMPDEPLPVPMPLPWDTRDRTVNTKTELTVLMLPAAAMTPVMPDEPLPVPMPLPWDTRDRTVNTKTELTVLMVAYGQTLAARWMSAVSQWLWDMTSSSRQ